VYPMTDPEAERATAAPHRYYTKQARHYLDGPVGVQPGALGQVAATADLRPVDIAAHDARMRHESLGNAVQLTARLYDRAVAATSGEGGVPDLNLDGDQGFAYPTWAAQESCTVADGTAAGRDRKRLGDRVTSTPPGDR